VRDGEMGKDMRNRTLSRPRANGSDGDARSFVIIGPGLVGMADSQNPFHLTIQATGTT
jgi:hypothetical protein